ncbi:MAG: hypothetical protein DRP06_01925 [Candidatus Aenigmatarchaeota archaeon]|nr:MAG: hypothetical protein DRP06_01925 [Candidatus Aenigmarchaeota archaeon]
MRVKVFLSLFLTILLITPGFAANCGGAISCSCGYFLNNSRTLNGSDNLTNCSGTALIINASDIILNCNGTTISGNTSGYGINLTNYNNATIKNCIVMNFSNGIRLYNSSDNNLTNNTVNDNNYGISILSSSNNNQITNNTANNNSNHGIYLYSSSNNTLTNNTINNNSENGIRLYNSSNNNLTNNLANDNNMGIYLYLSSNNQLINNTANNDINGIYLYYSSNNIVYNNFFNNTNNFNFVGTNQNHWNKTKQNGTRIYTNGTQIGGNYWTNPTGTGYSDTCKDYDNDDFCDEPYNLSTGNIDYLVLTNKIANLNLIPSWNNSHNYTGNKTWSAGTTEDENTTRNLFINLNQTKTFNFTINNSGDTLLYNLIQINSTNLTNTANSSLALNFTSIILSNNVSEGELGHLNITIEPPANSSYLGNYSGWIYLQSSNGEPYNYLNLTLNITVTNQTLPRFDTTNNVYYINSSNNSTHATFEAYFYDNQSIGKFWNTSKIYNFTLKNSTGTAIQTVSFSVDSNGLFSANINTTDATEGNYTLFGNATDEAGNFVEINSSFKLLYNFNLDITTDPVIIVKGFPFDFSVNVSKLGNFTAENVSVCLDWAGTGLNHSNLNNCTSVGDINGTNSGLAVWNFTGIEHANYTINVNVCSEDGGFNYTEQKEVIIRYGTLKITWKTEPPTDVDKDSEFYVKVYVNNTGNLNLTGVLVDITYSTSYFTQISGSDLSCDDCDEIFAGGMCDSCYWKLKGTTTENDRNIKVTATGNNATEDNEDKNVDINTPSTSSGDDDFGTNTYYGISFIKPTSSFLYIAQGGTFDLEVKLKNTGNTKLNDLYLTLSGLDSDYYSITPSVEDDLSSSNYEEYTIHFSIPEDFEAKNYDLVLKAISDEKEKEKSITLTVKQKDLEVYEVTDLNITQGESGTLTFYIKNTGEATLHNVYPALTGISSELFEINSSDTTTLYKDDIKYYAIKFTIPNTEAYGAKEINLTIASNEINISEQLTLTIIPSKEEKTTINDSYDELVAQLKVILNKLEKAKNENKNTSSIISGIESANLTLAQIEEYISNGNYAEAKNLIANLDTELNSMSSEFENLETVNNNSALLIIAVVAFSVMLVGVVVVYTFLPKKGYTPGKGYTVTSKKSSLEQSIKNIFKKLGASRNVEEKLRKKKLTEWKKWYKNETKKRKY